MSRASQFLRYLFSHLEQLRLIKTYRTPCMLRYGCTVLVYMGALLLTPSFVNLQCSPTWKEAKYLCPGPYVMAWAYVLITMLLLNVQVSGVGVS
jgi:hypothetical protein